MKIRNKLKVSARVPFPASWPAAAFFLLASACGGGGGGGTGWPEEETKDVSSDPEEPTGSGGATSGTCTGRDTETLTINRTFWHSGFRVTLGDALLTPATPACPRGELVIDAEFYNRGSQTQAFNARVLLEAGDRDYSGWHDTPSVPGERMGRGTFDFTVGQDFVLDEATLLVGDAYEHHAIIPIGANSPHSFVSLEVTDLDQALGEFDVGAVTFTITDPYIRADSPSDYRTHNRDELSLTFVYDATYHGGAGNAGVRLSRSSFLLDLPDGTSVAPAYASSKSISDVGATERDLLVRFTIPRPIEGEYALVAGGSWLSGEGYQEGQFSFELPSLPVFGED